MSEQPISSREDATQLIHEKLRGEPPLENKPEPQVEAPAEEVTAEEPAESASQEDPTSAEAHEGESQEQPSDEEGADDEQLPNSFAELAEAYGKSPEELMAEFTVTRKVGGQVQEVTLAEALSEHQLSADYTAKTQELSAKRQEFDSQRQQFDAQMTERIGEVSDLISTLESTMNAPVNVEAFVDTDTGEFDMLGYERAKQHQANLNGLLGQARSQREQLFQYHMQEQQKSVATFKEEQNLLLTAKFPEFTDPVKSDVAKGEIKTALQSYGFSPQEVDGWMGGPSDHRYVLVARDAAKYRALKAGEKSVVKRLSAKPPVTKPGASQPRKSSGESERKDIRARLRKSKSKQSQKALAEDIVKNALGR